MLRIRRLPYPPADQTFDALAPYIHGEKPVIFVAESERDIRWSRNLSPI